MAELINEQDSLNKGRVKINESILASERAEQNSAEALIAASEAKSQSESTQTQLDTIVINGDSSVEAAQARVSDSGHVYTTLKERLDTEHLEINNSLSKKADQEALDETNIKLEKGTAYYHEVMTESLFDITSNTTYHITTIKHQDSDGNIIKIKNGYYPGGRTVREFSGEKHATVAINAATFNVNSTDVTAGVLIIDGEIIVDTPYTIGGEYRYILGIKEDNTMLTFPNGTPASDVLAAGCMNAIQAFIPMIEDGQLMSHLLTLDFLNEKHPRQAIAMLPNKDIVILTCGGRGVGGDEGMTATQVATILQSLGASFAFMLDGGGSTQTVLRGNLINKPLDGGGLIERLVPSFLYFSKDVELSNRDLDIVSTNQDLGTVMKEVYDIQVSMSNVGNFLNEVVSVMDLDNLPKSGIYWAQATANGVPTNVSPWAVLHIKFNQQNAVQLAIPFHQTQGSMQFRRTLSGGDGTTWGAWRSGV